MQSEGGLAELKELTARLDKAPSTNGEQPALTRAIMVEALQMSAAVILSGGVGDDGGGDDDAGGVSSKRSKNNFRAAYALLSAVKKRITKSPSGGEDEQQRQQHPLAREFFASLFRLIQRVRPSSLSYTIILCKDLVAMCIFFAAKRQTPGLPEVVAFLWGLVRDGIHALSAGLHPGSVPAHCVQTGSGSGGEQRGKLHWDWAAELGKNFNMLLQPLRYYAAVVSSFHTGLSSTV